jgi:hypothetical protein
VKSPGHADICGTCDGIVNRAILLDGSDRTGLVVEECGGDVALRQRVEAALADIDRPLINA